MSTETEESIIRVRTKVLTKMLTSIVQSDAELSTRLELLFSQLESDVEKQLIAQFSRWLANHDKSALEQAELTSDHHQFLVNTKVEKSTIKTRIKVLSQMLESIIQTDNNISSRLELLFTQLGSDLEKDLITQFSLWISGHDKSVLEQMELISGRHQFQLRSHSEDSVVRVRTKVLSQMLASIIDSDVEFSSNLELLFTQLGSDVEKDLLSKFSRWMANQEKSTLSHSCSLASHLSTTPLDQQLTLLKEEVVIGQVMAEGLIRSTYMTEIFGDIGTVKIPLNVIHQESQHFNQVDMAYVCAMPKLRNAKTIFEIGTYRGQTTCGFADVCTDATIYTLNLPPEQDERYSQYIGAFIRNSPHIHRIHQIYADSLAFDPSPYSQAMDFIFIDGDHTYDFVKNDTEKAFKMLAPNGAIVWHDFAAKSEGVVRYLSELSRQKQLMRIKNTCLVLHIDGMRFDDYAWHPMQPSLETSEYG